MSALVSPVCGRACAMLSIFTARTRRSAVTGSPVKGDSSCAGEALELCAGLAGVPWPLPETRMRPVVTPATATAADAAATVFLRLHIMACHLPLRDAIPAAAVPSGVPGRNAPGQRGYRRSAGIGF